MSIPATSSPGAEQAPAIPRRRGRRRGRWRRPPPQPGSERITLIEFLWVGEIGIQPVLFLEREYLH